MKEMSPGSSPRIKAYMWKISVKNEMKMNEEMGKRGSDYE
jgi:hypothetical protein